jgi:thiamine biosynthesis protein ThiI
MQFIVKFFPEITIKSRPVRLQLAKQLRDNIRAQLRASDPDLQVIREWDQLVLQAPGEDSERRERVIDVLSRTAGIAHFQQVLEYPFVDLDDALEKTVAMWRERLRGKRFVVRCRRVGNHPFSSLDVERAIGAGLLQQCDSAGVDIRHPDETVRLEIRDDRLFIVSQRFPGIGGFPLGGQESVVALLSGGFDSAVAAYLTMRRGMRTHFCFFNLGGHAHEIGVKEVAHHLWSRYGSASRVKFIAVPFEGVVAGILKEVDDSHMGVVLKRMMLRAATQLAERLDARALVTGEAVAQVSSQTLTNLGVIDRATDMLVLRPLVTMAKGEIIGLAEQIGTAMFAAKMPEYCGVISVKPTTRAKLPRVEHEESRFDFALLEKAIADAKLLNIDELGEEAQQQAAVEVLTAPITGAVVIDVRAPADAERRPLKAGNVAVEQIPFYELQSRFSTLDPARTYLLYCDKGVMSRLHAAELVAQGHSNVKVYRPA